MRASTVAIALMPAPPTPTMWIARGAVRSSSASRSAGTGDLLHQVGEPGGGVGPPEGTGGVGHGPAAGRIGEERADLGAEAEPGGGGGAGERRRPRRRHGRGGRGLG